MKSGFLTKLTCQAAGIGMLAATLSACDSPSADQSVANASSGCRVVFLGDSITYELAQRTPSTSPSLGSHFSIVNASVRGGGLFHAPSVKSKTAMIKPGDHVIISIGANDTLSPAVNNIASGAYQADIAAFIDSVTEKGGEPVMLGYSIETNKFFNARANALINDNVNAQLRAVAAQRDIPFISTQGAARYDGVHVNNQGSQTIIARVWKEGGLSADPACHLAP